MDGLGIDKGGARATCRLCESGARFGCTVFYVAIHASRVVGTDGDDASIGRLGYGGGIVMIAGDLPLRSRFLPGRVSDLVPPRDGVIPECDEGSVVHQKLLPLFNVSQG